LLPDEILNEYIAAAKTGGVVSLKGFMSTSEESPGFAGSNTISFIFSNGRGKKISILGLHYKHEGLLAQGKCKVHAHTVDERGGISFSCINSVYTSIFQFSNMKS
jgi:hypothetical protein